MVLFLGNTYMKTYIHIIHKIELQNKRATIKRQERERASRKNIISGKQSRSLPTYNVASRRLLKLYIPRSVHTHDTYALIEVREAERTILSKKSLSHCNVIRERVEHRRERIDLLVHKYQSSTLPYFLFSFSYSLGLLSFALICTPNKQLVFIQVQT